MDGSERLRLFCALCLPADTVLRLDRWGSRALAAGRRVPPANLHVTLAFLGSRPADELAAIAAELRAAADGGGQPTLRLRGYRETRSVGMLTFDDEGGRAAALAARLGDRLEALGVFRRESRPWLPHVTVLRFRERPRLDPPLPELGEVSPSDAAVYSSVLRSDGAQYEILERATLEHTGLGG